MQPASPKMGSPIAVYVVFTVCLSLTTGFTPSPPGNPYANLNGQPCDPPFGYTRRNCGGSVLLSTTSEPAPRYKYGPNVCRVVKTYQLHELEYTWQTSCSWVYSHYQYRWVQQCHLACVAATTCDEATLQTVVRNDTACCDGYTTRQRDDEDFLLVYYHRLKEMLGCPVAFGPTLQQCIARQGLDTFYRLYRSVKWLCPPLLPLRQKGAKVTIFAPNDSAFESIALENLTTSAVCQLLSNHIVFERVDAKHLLSTKRLQAPTRLRLYANTVQYYFPLMDAVGRQVIRKARFVNGARVTLRDACEPGSVAGALHVIDRVITPVTNTTAQVLQSDPRLTMFTEALSRIGFLRILNTSIPHTVFAPTDEAFNNSRYSSELLDCLIFQGGLPLSNLLFYHIVGAVEFNNSLALQRYWVRSLFGPLRVQLDENNTVVLSEDKIEITEPDIPAQNGVVHIISQVLAPPSLDFRDCYPFSTTPPPTTPPPTTPLPTTPPPTTLPPTTLSNTTLPNTTSPPATPPPTTSPPATPSPTTSPPATPPSTTSPPNATVPGSLSQRPGNEAPAEDGASGSGEIRLYEE